MKLFVSDAMTSSSLDERGWTPATDALVVTNGSQTVSLIDDNADGGHNFYRVVATP